LNVFLIAEKCCGHADAAGGCGTAGDPVVTGILEASLIGSYNLHPAWGYN
jgi:hypothetical protein